VALWGLVRPAAGGQSVTIEVSDYGKPFHALATVGTDVHGYWRKRTRARSGRHWRVSWTAPDGTVYTGAAARAYP
jgi:hypothetical protein